MRVLFLLNYAGGGGAENYVQRLIERLHPHTAQCVLCCNVEGPLSERMRRMGVEVLHLPMRHPFDRRAAQTLAAYCIGNRIDIVHAQFPRENMIALRSRRFGSPAQVVYTAHLSRRQPLRWRILNRRYLRGNAAVIALQEEQKPLLLRNGVPEELLRVIPNGVAPPETPVLRPPAQGTLTLLTMARFSPEKGLLFLCDAVAALRKNGGSLPPCAAGRRPAEKEAGAPYCPEASGGRRFPARLPGGRLILSGTGAHLCLSFPRRNNELFRAGGHGLRSACHGHRCQPAAAVRERRVRPDRALRRRCGLCGRPASAFGLPHPAGKPRKSCRRESPQPV